MMGQKNMAKKIIFSLMALFILFVAIELLVRVVYYIKYKNSFYLTTPFHLASLAYSDSTKSVIYELNIEWYKNNTYFKFKPGTHTQRCPFHYDGKDHWITYYINKNGFRNSEINILKVKPRMICMGESSTAGLESPDGETFPAYLQRLLPNAEVINMGMNSYNASYLYNLLSSEACLYKPDLIVLYMGLNDFTSEISAESIKLNSWYKRVYFYIHNRIYYKIMSYTYLSEKIGVLLRKNAKPGMYFENSDPLPAFIPKLKKIFDFCQKNEIKVAFVCQVLNYEGDPQYCINLIEKINNGEDSFNKKSGVTTTSIIANFYRSYRAIEEFCAQYANVNFVDPRLDFYKTMQRNGKEDFFVSDNHDPVHLTPFGNKVLAEIIYRKINF